MSYQIWELNGTSYKLQNYQKTFEISQFLKENFFRLHLERYNEKWESKTPVDKRLTDEEVEHFIKSLLPVVFHILYNPFEEVSI